MFFEGIRSKESEYGGLIKLYRTSIYSTARLHTSSAENNSVLGPFDALNINTLLDHFP